MQTKFYKAEPGEYQFEDGTTNTEPVIIEVEDNDEETCLWTLSGEIIGDGTGEKCATWNYEEVLPQNQIIGFEKISTAGLISSFQFENGNPMTDQFIIDNQDGTITIVLEGVAKKDFPKPFDYEEYIETLGTNND